MIITAILFFIGIASISLSFTTCFYMIALEIPGKYFRARFGEKESWSYSLLIKYIFFKSITIAILVSAVLFGFTMFSYAAMYSITH